MQLLPYRWEVLQSGTQALAGKDFAAALIGHTCSERIPGTWQREEAQKGCR